MLDHIHFVIFHADTSAARFSPLAIITTFPPRIISLLPLRIDTSRPSNDSSLDDTCMRRRN